MFRSHIGASVPERDVQVKSGFHNGMQGTTEGRLALVPSPVLIPGSRHIGIQFQQVREIKRVGSEAHSWYFSQIGLGRAFSKASEEL